MDIRELRYFAAVFRERNLTAAARRCFISQPSISAAITNLEAELGAALFIRHKKGVAPTQAAEQFHAVARRIIDEADAAKNLFRKPATRNALTLGLMRTLDPGTMGGDEGSRAFLLAMLTVTLGGIFIVSILIGILTTGIEGKLEQLRKGRSFVAETGHTVVLGWSSQIFTLLSELIAANACRVAVFVLRPDG